MAVKSLLSRIKPLPRFHPVSFFSSSLSNADSSPVPTSAPDPNLINDICRILSDFRSPHHDLSSALLPFSSLLSPSLSFAVLRRCRHLPVPCHRFFLFSLSLPGFRHTPDSLRLLASSLAAARLYPLLWSLLSDLYPDYKFTPDLFRLLFRYYARAHLPDDAIRAFRRMPGYGLEPGIDDFHAVLSALCKNRLAEHAEPFFHNHKSQFEVTQKSYTILIAGWADLGKFENAVLLFDEMLQRGLAADVPAYNALIAAFCKSGEVDEAHMRLLEMQRIHGLEPDAATYSVFTRAACEAKDVRSAVRVLDSMKKRRLVPNVFTYNAVVKLFCEKDMIVEAYELLDEMIASDAKPDVWSYNAILNVHCRLHEVNKALRLLERMDNNSCLPDRHTYNMLLKMLIGVGRIDRALEVWNGMEGRGFYPSAASYAVMIHGLCRKKGRVEEACGYFERMVDEGIPPYLSTCELVRGKLLQIGFRDRVMALVGKMQRSTSCTIQELSSAMDGSKRMEQGQEDAHLDEPNSCFSHAR
ncbi:uncharacterized protein [Typha angustifolia]|uniref:uncharacterized protein n=1 Tax=Typha angustifolia TaxID=59011 RepID=UPI003C2C425C